MHVHSNKLVVTLGTLALIAILLASCSPLIEEETTGRQPAAPPPAQLTEDQMRNAAYAGIYETPVPLTDGVYEGKPFVEGGVARPVVTYIDNTLTYGDLDGDGLDDAVVLLMENSGGSGDFAYIGAQLNRAGNPVDAGAALLGDRVQLLSLRVEGEQVVAEIVTQAADEGLCCGTRKLRTRLALQEGALIEVGSDELGTVGLDDLMGSRWMLHRLNFDQPPLAGVAITADFDGGRVTGRGGCNDYGADVTSDGGQLLAVGPVAGTMMACDDETMALESAYLIALQRAFEWRHYPGQLAITYLAEDGAQGTLFFNPRSSTDENELVDSALSTRTPTLAAGAPQLLDRACDLYMPAGEVEGETIECGAVRVPWDRSEGTTTDLAYVILKATGEDPQQDAIVHVAGGPGIGSTLREPVLEFIKRYAPLRTDRDIVLYDQRGMGHSVPFFQCPYPDEAQSADIRARLAAVLDAEPGETDVNNAYCQAQLSAQGYSPSAISTHNSAADLVDIMDALDYESYNLYGISYGTRLLMSLLHHFPQQANVRSVVLDSLYPLPEDSVNDYSPIGHLAEQALFEEIFELCVADPACNAAFPNLRTQFDGLVNSLSAQPLTLPDGSEFSVKDLYQTLFPFNPTVGYVAYQPRLIAELAQENPTTLLQLRNGEIAFNALVMAMGEEDPRTGDLIDAFMACEMDWSDEAAVSVRDAAMIALWDAEAAAVQQFLAENCLNGSEVQAADLVEQLPAGLFNNIIIRFAPDTIQGVNSTLNSKLSCTEQFPFAAAPADIATALQEAGQPAFLVEQTLAEMAARADGCAGWSDALSAPTPATYGETPVLILNGQFDANTPPVYAELARSQLPNVQLVIIPNAGHSILGNHGNCPTQMVQQFLTAPGQTLETDCTTEMQVQFQP